LHPLFIYIYMYMYVQKRYFPLWFTYVHVYRADYYHFYTTTQVS